MGIKNSSYPYEYYKKNEANCENIRFKPITRSLIKIILKSLIKTRS